MLKTLATILKDNWKWRSQIGSLAVFDLKKKSRGAVLSWAWFFIKPAMYLFCFWFALKVGLRSGSTDPNDPPYFLWLASGMMVWFFISEILGPGLDVLRRYPYLVNKLKFPLSGISTIFTTATMIVQFMLLAALFVIYFISGMKLDIYLLQVPVMLVVLFVFWNMVSIMFSQLTAISRDVKNLMQSIKTPIFWLSGIIFDCEGISIPIANIFFDLNPVTFFARWYRAAFYDKTWIWSDPSACIGFAIVFAIVLVLMIVVYKLFNEEVADVM